MSVGSMSPQRRTALVSVIAAAALIAVKLIVGLETGSLGLLSDAAHSGSDFVAALLTFFVLGVAIRPADPSHPWGHGKAEHLAALAEAAVLIGASRVMSLVLIVVIEKVASSFFVPSVTPVTTMSASCAAPVVVADVCADAGA